MKFTNLLLVAALFSTSEALKLTDFNGADEDEIMDKVFSKYSSEAKDHNGVGNGQMILMKKTAPKAAGVILEATHKLKGKQVPGYIKANFEKTWERFDINSDGFIKADETHTFMRSLMGKLNKFALAPGSLSDVGGGPTEAPAAKPAAAPKQEAVQKKKKAVVQKKAEEADDGAAAEQPAAQKDEETPSDDSSNVELEALAAAAAAAGISV
eukprot:CAMPEP_0170490468 /NCGR_PEP_ID=MMETSP0208-20121228/8642_1 /TAXON_ID=197538 /ORGANISM="Strombidium inclinatum, Strain S3" /LENGTH=210 /DNA_ID=CAMNT_0010765843 /DNA_START=48 /DNA_END=680 /DNA_ORIENTATION=+